MNKPQDLFLYYPKFADSQRICRLSEDGRHRFLPPSNQCADCSIGGVIVNNEVLYVPTEKGVEYHLRTDPNVLFWGGRGSAKSTTGRWDAHMRALANPGFSYIILRRTFPQLQQSHLKFIPREMALLGGSFNQTMKKAMYPNGSIGFFSHCATEDDVLNLLSAEFSLAFFDEISTFEWDQFTKLAASVRAPVGSGIIPMVRAATNPLGPSAMKILEYFVDKNVDPDEDPDYNPNDWYAIKANLTDNPYLPTEQYMKRFSGLPPHVRKAWVEGEFSMENALFDFRPTITKEPVDDNGSPLPIIVKPYHVIKHMDIEKVVKSATIYRAIDAGWFPDPTVCLWIAHLGSRHIIFNEKTWYKTTAVDVATDIREEDKRLGVSRVAMTYCDPTMDINTSADIRSIKELYEDNGIPMESSINKRDHFATAMHNALAEEAYEDTPRLQIYNNGARGCPMLVRTIPQMRFDEKDTKFMADHKQDHWVVAACYYLMSHSSESRKEHHPQGPTPKWMQSKQVKMFRLGSDQVR